MLHRRRAWTRRGTRRLYADPRCANLQARFTQRFLKAGLQLAQLGGYGRVVCEQRPADFVERPRVNVLVEGAGQKATDN